MKYQNFNKLLEEEDPDILLIIETALSNLDPYKHNSDKEFT